MQKQTKAFTLVELIVVIVILSILGTIAFISFQGYSRNSRDSVRVSDINNLEKSLGIFVVKTGFYPIPDNSKEITYLGGTAWIEGTLGDTVMKNIDSVSKKTIDPLTANEYTYSITTAKTEYEIGSINEGGDLTQVLIDKSYAANLSDKRAVIKGNYNEKILKVSTGGINYILAMPTIVVTDISDPKIENLRTQKKLVYNNYNNIPHSYNPTGTTQSGGFNFQSNGLEVYSGTTINFDDNASKITFMTNLKNAYSGTIIGSEEVYKDILNMNPQTEQDKAVNLVNNYITTNVGGISGKITTIVFKTCTLNGQILNHNQTITTYSETSILYGANYSCTDRDTERTCNDGTLSGDEAYSYTSCVKGEPTNCSANTSYTYNGHTYSISSINHGQTATNIDSQVINISNGTQVYKLTSIGCNDGVLVNETEETNPTVTCDSGYIQSGNICISAMISGQCLNLPTNGLYYNGTTNYILSGATAGTSLDSIVAGYNSTPAINTCQWKCITGYNGVGNFCIDQVSPTISSVIASSPSCNTIRYTITASDNIGLHTSAYSFDGGSTWQSGNTKDYTSNSLTKSGSDFKVRDISGNISTYGSNVSGSSTYDQCLTNGFYVISSDNTNYPNGCATAGLTDPGYKCIYKIVPDNIYISPGSYETSSTHRFGYSTNDYSNIIPQLLGTTNGSATSYCTSLKNSVPLPAGTNWYLPYGDATQLIYNNRTKIINSLGNTISTSTNEYWTSNRCSYSKNAQGVLTVVNWSGYSFNNYTYYCTSSSTSVRVRCITK